MLPLRGAKKCGLCFPKVMPWASIYCHFVALNPTKLFE